MNPSKGDFFTSLISGSVAGLCVDVVLFPLDTIKTRLQSADGFVKSGGFRGIYRGIGSAAIGSAPSASLFFSTYETVKACFRHRASNHTHPAVHMLAACSGEIVACIARVPTEVVKQRTMTSQCRQISSFAIFKETFHSEGVRGFYRGYFSTVFREIPFSLIQFPLWEYLKRYWSDRQGKPVQPWQSSVCGAFSGGIAAALTTPLDVAKTRIMLAKTDSYLSKGHIITALVSVYKLDGFVGLFAGVLPRVLWISIGGAIFLGIYDKAKKTITALTSTEIRT